MKDIWLLYESADLRINADFAAMMRRLGMDRGMAIQPVTVEELTLGMDGQGKPFILKDSKAARPDAVLSRMRLPLYSHHLEAMDVKVYNNATVCELCNDKRRTHQFLTGLPMAATRFLTSDALPPAYYPVVIKPACSHGGDRVAQVDAPQAWQIAAQGILPEPALEQQRAECLGKDLRVYVVFGQIVAAVMRTAHSGIVSNFKCGGNVALHTLTSAEETLVQRVIRRFDEAGAPLSFAGVDLLYNRCGPIVGEVEDVVGSRMLYQTSDMDIAALFLDGLALKLQAG